MESTVNSNRYIPSAMDTNLDYNECGNCEVFFTNTNENSGKAFYVIGFVGKSKNSSFHYRFSTKERMMNHIEQFVENCKKNLAYKLERKAKQKAANALVTVKVGQIFHYSWGYDQTNCDFYQVISVKGKTAVLKAIGSRIVKGSEGFMCCNLVAVKDSFLSGNRAETITKRVQAGYNGEAMFSMDFGSLTLTDESTPHYSSWYA